MTQQSSSFSISGGLDLVTPMLAKKPGRAIAALNYEPTGDGYTRLTGYERYDGSAAPSTTTLYRWTFVSGASAIAVGNEVIATSGAQGTVVAVSLTSGSWAGSDAAGYIDVALASNSVTTASGNISKRSGGVSTFAAFTSSSAVETTGLVAALAATPAACRASIGVVPGSGPVRAIFSWNGVMYAIRDNAGATAGVLYYAGTGTYMIDGWRAATGTYIANFDLGGVDGATPTEGQLVDKLSGPGGSAFYMGRIVVRTGSFSAGNATGYIILNSNIPASGDYLYDAANSVLRLLRLTSTPLAITLPAGGTYRYVTHNFFGSSNRRRAYFANGVGYACEVGLYTGFTTVAFAPIITGATTDTPTHVAEHKNSLFLAYAGGAVLFSQVGEPMGFSALLGAGEADVGDTVTSMVDVPSALAILCEQSIHMLYGNDSTDYQLETLSRNSGALALSAKQIGDLYYLDNAGIRSLRTAQAFGNFIFGTASADIAPLLNDKRRDGVTPVGSLVCRLAGQYWLFFSDGTGIIGWMGGKHPWWMPINLGVTVSCTYSTEESGVERLFIGCTNGYVYELNRGTSFDGNAIEHYVRLPYYSFGSPDIQKRVDKAVVEVKVSIASTIAVTPSFDLGSVANGSTQTLAMTVGGAAIGNLATDELYYNSQIEAEGEVYLDGICRNVSLKIGGSTSTEQPHTLSSVTYHVSPRELKL